MISGGKPCPEQEARGPTVSCCGVLDRAGKRDKIRGFLGRHPVGPLPKSLGPLPIARLHPQFGRVGTRTTRPRTQICKISRLGPCPKKRVFASRVAGPHSQKRDTADNCKTHTQIHRYIHRGGLQKKAQRVASHTYISNLSPQTHYISNSAAKRKPGAPYI